MLKSEVIFLEFVTGTSDFGGKLLKNVPKKKKKNATLFFGDLRSVNFWPNDGAGNGEGIGCKRGKARGSFIK